MATENVDDILRKYGGRLDSSSRVSPMPNTSNVNISSEFQQFKNEMLPKFSRYENWCNNIGGSLKIKLSEKDNKKIQKNIDSAHLETRPENVVSLAVLSFILTLFAGILLSAALYLLTFGTGQKMSPIILIFFLCFLTAGFLFYYFYSMPSRLANQWRLRAGSQMVPCILYTVVYMKHTSNLERAIRFASQHLEPPLALDLKKVFWDVETGKYSTIKESLDVYLETWRETNSEFVESFNLIESSLFEPSEARRMQILERSLQVILDGVYDKMMKYSHDVKAPLTNLYMLGIVLPTLALALIPLASALMNGAIKWYHVFILFNLLVPFFVFYMTNNIMLRRPGGYGESSILELNPLYAKYKSHKPYWKAAAIAVPLLILGLLPFIFQYTPIPVWLGLKTDYSFYEIGLSFLGDAKLFDFITSNGVTVGPMGTFALILSMFIPLSIVLFYSISYKLRTQEIIKSRDYSKMLEAEFNNSLFQLGNRIGDGTPAELAFARVAESSKGLVTADFFRAVNSNIQSMGMPLDRAIFDPKRGAIINYPSNLISTSMHILVESVKKGLQVAAASLMSIADYIRNINKINDRLRDLLAEVTSDMKSNMTFLAPILAGFVVGLSSMITLILTKLKSLIDVAGSTDTGIAGKITGLFGVENLIPPYFLQVCVGIYIIEIIFILTKTLVTVDSGPDELKSTYEIGKNLLSGGLLYYIVALVALIALSSIAAVALPSLV
ncbi:MAG: hypothetical protein AABX17_02135 [Nanoarchaeota archaeon]